MNTPPRRSSPPPEGGEGSAWSPSLGFLAVAVGVVAGGLAFWLMASPSPGAAALEIPQLATTLPAPQKPMPDAATAGIPVAAMHDASAMNRSAIAPENATASTPRVSPPAWEPGTDPTPDLSAYLNPGETPTMAEVIDRLHQAGVYSGLGAFSPPGTRPPLVGLAVPEDFALPEGYVRHHQATDDGQRIEPILMFSPDYRFVDAAGNRIAIPDDGVVPPELAPPGLPIRRIVIPEPADPRRPGR
jgi:hypothetical protein